MDYVVQDAIKQHGGDLVLSKLHENLLFKFFRLSYLVIRREEVSLYEVNFTQKCLIHRFGSIRGQQRSIELPLVIVVVDHLE